MALYLVIGTAFALGENFPDPDSVLFAATWVIPAAALSVLALLRPAMAERVLSVALIVVAVLLMTGMTPSQVDGPEATIYAFALSIPLAFLGLKRAGTAGKLLIGTGLALAVGVEVFNAAPPASARAVFVPLLIFGLLFWMTKGSLGGGKRRPRKLPSASEAYHA
jgi:hypothetical protein